METPPLSPLRTLEYHVGEALKRIELVRVLVDAYHRDDSPLLPLRKTLLLRSNIDYALNTLKEIKIEFEWWRLKDENGNVQGFWDPEKGEEVLFEKEET